MDHYTGTKPVAASHLFDTAALERYLAERLPGFAGQPSRNNKYRTYAVALFRITQGYPMRCFLPAAALY